MFDNLNLYSNIDFIQARSPQELIDLIKQIKTPIRIISIVTNGGFQVCYFQTNNPVKKVIEKKKKDIKE